jgi:Arc/MetJ-type ribon-helix-helix transcriptional regulator
MKHPGTSRNARVAVRLTREEQHQVEEAAKTRGYANSSAFIRAAIRTELDGRAERPALTNGLELALIVCRAISSAWVADSRRYTR